MKLATQAPGMIRHLTNLNVNTVGRLPGKTHSGVREHLLEVAVEFVAMPMALTDIRCAIRCDRETSFRETAGVGAQTHRAAEFIHPFQLAELENHAMRGCGIKFG